MGGQALLSGEGWFSHKINKSFDFSVDASDFGWSRW